MLQLNLLSFGYKHGFPKEANLVFDLRFLKNPYFEPKLKEKNGLDPEVQNFVTQQKEAQLFLKKLKAMLRFLIPLYLKKEQNTLTLALGCTGGQHRSVSLIESLAKENFKNALIKKTHRDLNKN
ncbi:MAG: hypothetical protein KDK66_02135 [Deltaproteobacteria bacterium]|nr:hypothetical protein [Deltaproteobacteria bacterium]